MKVTRLAAPVIAASALCLVITLCAESQEGKATNAEENKPATSKSKSEIIRVDVAVARDRAKQMHEIYSATLDVIHHRYFHGDRATIPARAMEDVFKELKYRQHVEARWISVNTKAMSIDHDPKSDFEKQAAKELSDGKEEIEAIEDGYYRRASTISLHAGCLSCHEGLFQSSSKKPRYAGLVISIPVQAESKKTD